MRNENFHNNQCFLGERGSSKSHIQLAERFRNGFFFKVSFYLWAKKPITFNHNLCSGLELDACRQRDFFNFFRRFSFFSLLNFVLTFSKRYCTTVYFSFIIFRHIFKMKCSIKLKVFTSDASELIVEPIISNCNEHKNVEWKRKKETPLSSVFLLLWEFVVFLLYIMISVLFSF